MISFLTLPEHEHVPNTVEELAAAADYKIGYIDYKGTAGESYLRENNRPAIKAILSRLNVIPPRESVKGLMGLATERKFVMLDYQKISTSMIASNLTLYPGVYPAKQGESFFGILIGPAFRKYSKLSEVMSITIAALGETGHFLKRSEEALETARRRGRSWLKTGRKTLYHHLKTMALESLYPTMKPFSLHHFTFSFLYLSAGCILAVAAFLSEFFVKQCVGLAGKCRRY